MNLSSPPVSAWRCWLASISAGLAITSLASHAHAQTVWNLRTSPTVPPARQDTGLAFDSLRGQTVMFGGQTGAIALFDTWEWDGTNWALRFPANSPPARDSGRLVFDSGRGLTVLFGGYTTGAANDTWEWDGTNWTQRTPAGSPPPRYYHAMAHDQARGETVLFGGYGGGYLGDTWVWNGTTWTQRFPTSSPGARTQMAMAYDAARQRVIAFGGRLSPTNYPGSTWEWDGTNWIQASPLTSPGPRESSAMAYDSLRQRVVLFGGNNSVNQQLNDTWEWDGSNWLQRMPALAPAPVRYHAMAYDSTRSRTVVFGGRTSTGQFLNQTWEYYHPTPATYVLFGSGCPGSAGTPNLGVAANELPWLGETFEVNLTNAPSVSIGVLAWGLSNTSSSIGPLPFNLGILGAPLCNLLVDPVHTEFSIAMAGNATVGRFFPNNPAIAGALFYDQFAVLDAGANALGLSFSQGGAGRVALK
ncbi:MAG: kelch repeat-containing protein [Planctomycetota bacterium]